MLVPAVLVLGLILWPLLSSWLGPGIARRLGWRAWPAPKRNVITGTIWIAGLAIIAALTLWSALAPQLCIPRGRTTDPCAAPDAGGLFGRDQGEGMGDEHERLAQHDDPATMAPGRPLRGHSRYSSVDWKVVEGD